eukprot:1757110-Amphidinium_carterae.1
MTKPTYATNETLAVHLTLARRGRQKFNLAQAQGLKNSTSAQSVCLDICGTTDMRGNPSTQVVTRTLSNRSL